MVNWIRFWLVHHKMQSVIICIACVLYGCYAVSAKLGIPVDSIGIPAWLIIVCGIGMWVLALIALASLLPLVLYASHLSVQYSSSLSDVLAAIRRYNLLDYGLHTMLDAAHFRTWRQNSAGK